MRLLTLQIVPIYSWGHDFRPAYRRLNWLREAFPYVPCMACTATATPQVVEDIQRTLRLQNCPVFQGSFDRPNIFYKVRYKESLDLKGSSSTIGAPASALDDMVTWIVKKQLQHQQRNEKCSGIVYVHKREDTSLIAQRINLQAVKMSRMDPLARSGPPIRAEPYHAGLKKAERNRVLEEWSTDKVQVAVATVAFGMGIDLAHVRYVVHWTIPKTVEGFYQESGRAGRDGLPSYSLLYFSPGDVRKFQYLIRKQGEQQQKKAKQHTQDNVERKLQGLEQMVKYCTAPQCRRNILIRHFGGKAVECKKTCDFCKDPKRVKRDIQTGFVVRDVVSTQKGGRFRDRNGRKKTEWDGQWPHAYGDEEGLAHDWGESIGMVGDLRVSSTDPVDERIENSRNPKVQKAGFRKASSILEKFETLETRVGSGFVNFREKQEEEDKRPSTHISIPEHLRQDLFDASKKASRKQPETQKKPELTSEDHARKAAQLKEELAKIDAERESRVAALLAKRKAAAAARAFKTL